MNSEAATIRPLRLILDHKIRHAPRGVGGSSDMKLRIKSWLIAGSLIVSVVGCNEPQGVVPVAPPGFDIVRKPPAGEAAAQAIGETGIDLKSTPKPAVVRPNTANSPPTPIGQSITTVSGLIYETLKEGTGPTVVPGQPVTMSYTGKLTDGTVFDSSNSFSITIGIGKFIGGWEEGVPGMKVGERRKLTIPPALGYKEQGSPPKIPGNATLIFEVEVLEGK
jgi:FKBP-type peptidyl-prolyl cis-trans isomerase